MESMTNSTEDYLIDGLSFKLPPGASYITDRKSSTFWSVGSNAYTPVGGVKLIKFQLNGDDSNWLDPSTVVFQFELVNTTDGAGATILRPLGQPHLFFKRLRVLAGGQVVEDIQDFGRNSELIASLQNDHVRDNYDAQGFGNRFDNDDIRTLSELPIIGGTAAERTAYELLIKQKQRALLPAILPGTSKIVNFRPMSGLLAGNYLIPLKFVPLVFEFELGDTNDAVVAPQVFSEASGYADVYDAANTTNQWQIQNACIKCDIVTLDSSLNDSFIKHLLSGKSLPMKYSTFISQQSAVVGKSFSVQVIRAVTKLQKAFITFYRDVGANRTPFDKSSIYFHHPMREAANVIYSPNHELQISLQLGSKLYPEYPTNNLSECFYRLKEAMNLPDWHQHSIAIKFKDYAKNKFIFATDFQKIADAAWSGVNTKSGQVLMVNVKAMNEAGITANDIATTMYTLLQAEQILEIRDVGCTVYD